ncbi:hypothetical protein VNI00_000259 [Paramarasmius palmivorus]|uniref:Uncharacterized protein n=1 Tax=Paramarasmius palmivorus TaxID=297713 RepID=A0AAW0EEU2_9AGAR
MFKEPVEVPSALEMFQDDTCARFFVNKLGNGMEQLLLRIAWDNLHQSNIEAFFTDSGAEAKRRWQPDYLKWRWQNQLCHLPDEVASLRFSTLYSRSIGAVAMWPDSGLVYSWRNVTSNLVERTAILSNGLTRFTLQSSDDPALRDSELVIENDIYMLMAQAWFLQSSRICNATVDEDTIVTIAMLLSLRGTIEGWCPALDESVPPIFLFVYPPPMTVAEYGLWDEVPPYFWSFDETGQYQMSEDEHKLWGLPVLKPKKSGIRVQSWPAHVYKSLRAWQTARGFDPTTSYWAQTLGYPELTIVEPEDQACVEVSEETNVVDSYGKKFKKGLRRLWGFK